VGLTGNSFVCKAMPAWTECVVAANAAVSRLKYRRLDFIPNKIPPSQPRPKQVSYTTLYPSKPLRPTTTPALTLAPDAPGSTTSLSVVRACDLRPVVRLHREPTPTPVRAAHAPARHPSDRRREPTQTRAAGRATERRPPEET